jgi:nuclear receptor-binding protein
MEDVKYGIYPLTAFAMAVPPPSKAEPSTPELHRSDSEKANEPEPQDEESRRVNTMQCDIQRLGEGDKGLSGQLQLRILLRMEDNMNRQLSCSISQEEDPVRLADELVQHGFIHPVDHCAIKEMLLGALAKYAEEGAYPASPALPPIVVPR